MHARLHAEFRRALDEYFYTGAHTKSGHGGWHYPWKLSEAELQRRTGIHIPTLEKGWISVARDNEERKARVKRGLELLAAIIEYQGPVFEPSCRLFLPRRERFGR